MSPEEQQEQLLRLRDDMDALQIGTETPFWKILDRELAKREHLAFETLTAAKDGAMAMRAVGELLAIRGLRSLPSSLSESYRGIIAGSRERK